MVSFGVTSPSQGHVISSSFRCDTGGSLLVGKAFLVRFPEF